MITNSFFGGLSSFCLLSWHRARAWRLSAFPILGLILAACTAVVAQPKVATTTAGAAGPEAAQATVPGEVTTVRVSQVGSKACNAGKVPVTFGQPFRKNDVPRGQTIQAYLQGRPLPTQTDIRTRNDNGSARHAVITVLLPCETVDGDAALLALASRPQRPQADTGAISVRDVIASGFDASVALDVSGKTWTLDAGQLLKIVARAGGCEAAGKFCTPWLSGPLASEWIVGGPLVDSSGTAHPHLAAYFAVRAYGPAPVSRVRVDVILENDWAYVPDPHNYTYDATIAVGGKGVYAINDLEHYRQARWHEVFWWGEPGVLYAALDSDYLQASRAVPQYQEAQPSEKMLASARQDCPPMRSCDQTATMANTGAQAAIGPLPRWAAVYVLDTGYRAYRWMLANADALGAYGIHYRDKDTGKVLSIEQHPCMTTLWPARVEQCPVPPHGNDLLPSCKGDCDSPLAADEPHHPSPAYVAYITTGDWYYMNELQFWANWVVFWQNPAYREYAKGLVHQTQVRGQAWALRTLGQAAYILPERAPLKDYFVDVVENNIEWYNEKYTNNSEAYALRIIPGYKAIVYSHGGDERTAMSTWQQSFFTWAVGNLADKGFEGAEKLRDWFAPFQIGLMTSPGFCWEMASAYKIKVRDSRDSPIYQSLAEVYRNSFPKLKDMSCDNGVLNAALKRLNGSGFPYPPRTMSGYPTSPTGFPANFQIGLAASVDSGLPGAEQAWQTFIQRSSQPSYATSPQFAVVPRTVGRQHR